MAQFVQLSRPPPPCQRSLSPIEAETGRSEGALRPLDRCYVKIEIHLQPLVYILLLPTPKSKWRRVIVVPASQQLSVYNLEAKPQQHGTLYIFGDCTTTKSLYLAE